MHSFSYPATFRRDAQGRVVVGFPDLPEAHTDGRNMAEAVEEAVDCLGSVLAFRIAEKSEIPEPSRLKRGQRLVPVPRGCSTRTRGSGADEGVRPTGQRNIVVVTGIAWAVFFLTSAPIAQHQRHIL